MRLREEPGSQVWVIATVSTAGVGNPIASTPEDIAAFLVTGFLILVVVVACGWLL